MINETLEANRAYQRDKDDAYNRGYKQGKADAEPNWIPVTERLPEVGKTVLFCDYDRDIYVGHRAIEHWWSVDDKVKNVTAWMPLPEPFKEVTE